MIYITLFILVYFTFFYINKKILRIETKMKAVVLSVIFSLITVIGVYGINICLIFPYDNVRITVTEGHGVAIQSIEKQGKKLNYRVVEGSWLDRNNLLEWIDGGNIGLTRYIVLRIPKGENRELVFISNKWAGKVTVSINNGNEIIVDNYTDSESNMENKINLSDTNGFIDLKVSWIFIICFETMIVFVLICVILTLGKNLFLNALKKDKFQIIYLILAIMGFFIMMMYGEEKSGFIDDLATIGFANKDITLKQVIKNILNEDPTTAPLSYILFHFWYKLIPIGITHLNLWLRIPFIIANSFALYFMGIITRKGWNKYIGLLAECVLLCSSTFILNSSYSIRPYGLFCLVSVFAIFSMIEKIKYGYQLRTGIISVISMLLLAFTHYFGILMCIGFFAFETVRWIRKRQSLQYILYYFVTALLFLPWIMMVMQGMRAIYKDKYWPEIPTIFSIFYVIKWLLSGQNILFFFLLLGIAITIYKIYEQKECCENIVDLNLFSIITVLITIGIAYIYSAHINSKASVWVSRYFIGLLPILSVLVGYGIYSTVKLLFRNMDINLFRLYICLTIMGMLTIGIDSYITVKNDVSSIYEPYKEVADYLLSRTDINNEDTLVAVSSTYSIGWNYYLTHNGKFNLISYGVGDTAISNVDSYKKLYLFNIHTQFSDEYLKKIEEKFDLSYKDDMLHIYEYLRKTD